MSEALDRRIDFEPMRAEHLAPFGAWIRTDHVRPWWGDPDEELEKVRDMIAGRDSTRPFMLRLDGRAVGYIQVWYLDDWRDAETLAGDPWVAHLPAGTVGVDICIGEEALIGRGIGAAAVRKFTQALAERGHAAIIIDPDPANARAVRAYGKAGYRPIPTLLGKTEGVLIMQYDPEAVTKAP